MKIFSWPDAWRGWRPQHDQVIKLLLIVGAVCGVLATAAGLGLSPTAVAWLAAIATIASTVKDVLNQKAVTQALYTPPPPKRQEATERVAVPDPPEGTQSYG